MICYTYLIVTTSVGLLLIVMILIERNFCCIRRKFKVREDDNAGDAHMTRDFIEIHNKIGEGSSADIYFGSWKSVDVAVKKSKSHHDILIDEIVALRQLVACPFVIKLEGVIRSPLHVVIALEYLPNGTLSRFSARSKASQKDYKLMTRILTDICNALVFVHDHGYVHADVAARNIMISSEWRGRLIDFGSSIRLRNGESRRYIGEVAGPIRWLPPETVSTNIYSKATDVYSFGVTIWETFSRRVPWENLSLPEVTISVRNGATLDVPATLPGELKDVMKSCFTFEVDARPNAPRLLDMMRAIEHDT
jgi:serine/threonine protein kinase